jgi:hypothetical protein
MLNELPVDYPLTYVASIPVHNLGALYQAEDTGYVYRYVRAGAACANGRIAATESVCKDSGGDWWVNNDFAGGTGLGVNFPAGLAIAAIPQGFYGWVLVNGVGTAISDGAVSAGEAIVLDSANDGDVDTMAAGEEHQVFAVATADDSGTAVNLVVRVI